MYSRSCKTDVPVLCVRVLTIDLLSACAPGCRVVCLQHEEPCAMATRDRHLVEGGRGFCGRPSTRTCVGGSAAYPGVQHSVVIGKGYDSRLAFMTVKYWLLSGQACVPLTLFIVCEGREPCVRMA